MMAGAALPWLRKDVWIPLTSSVLVDVDHYLWHSVAHRTLSLRAATRYFGRANPRQPAQSRLLHHPLLIGAVIIAAAASRSRALRLITSGVLFHVSLDLFHVRQTARLKRSLIGSAQGVCESCRRRDGALELHTLRFAGNPLVKYRPRNFTVLCSSCHERAHDEALAL
ncbi:MAG: hypothetical protein DLM67_22385 [Candidatus Nephthysia bennettiae]|nr:MAG: hypothetical protein DLM67_22385 [Candidatus Dormibacteraeota bacterium]